MPPGGPRSRSRGALADTLLPAARSPASKDPRVPLSPGQQLLGWATLSSPVPPAHPGKRHLPGVGCGCGTPTPRSPARQPYSKPLERTLTQSRYRFIFFFLLMHFYCHSFFPQPCEVGFQPGGSRSCLPASPGKRSSTGQPRGEMLHRPRLHRGGIRHPPHITAPSLPLLH